MHFSRQLILVAAIVSLTAGCASMSAKECTASDWRAIGLGDGARGYTNAQFSGRQRACAKHGITADFDGYQEGRKQGLVEYCQPSRGFQVGANGGTYNGVCNASLEPGFLETYRIGRELHELRSAVSHLKSSRNQRESMLETIDEDIQQKEISLIARETPTEERVLILADLKQLSEDKISIRVEIEQLAADITAAELELFDYEQSIAEFGY